MTGQSKGDKQRDVISLSSSARVRRSELDALESEVLIALEKALEATKQADSEPTLAPLQPEQQQFDDREPDRRRLDTQEDDDLPRDHLRADSTGVEPQVAHSPEPAQFQSMGNEPLTPDWSGTGRSTRVRVPAEPARAEQPPREDWRGHHRRAEFSGSDSAPFARLQHDFGAGHPLAVGPDEHGRREDIVQILRQQHRSAAHDASQQPQRKRRTVVAIVARLALASAVAGAVAFSVFQFLSADPQAENSPTSTQVGATLWARLSGTAQNDQPPVQPARRLVLSALSSAANRPIALGVNVEAVPPGAYVVIKGLPSGSRITAGSAAGDGVWRVPVRDLARAAVVPPADFVGAMDLPVDLNLADGTVADSNVLRLEWTPSVVNAIAPTPVKTMPVKTTPVVSTKTAFPPPPEPPAIPQATPPVPGNAAGVGSDAAQTVPRRLDAEELANLLKRAENYLQNGDIAAARLLLRLAAEAGDAPATIALAATYDPAILKQLGALGAKGDVAKARAWYQKASELGSPEAQLRLQRLTQDAR